MKEYELEAVNVFYLHNFNVIGGVETFIYEIAKKYHKYDITVIYQDGDIKQVRRLEKLVRVHKWRKGYIKCKKIFCNYECDILDWVDAEDYVRIIHAMYITNKISPSIHPKITSYLAVSEPAAKEWYELTGLKARVCKNPLSLTEEEKQEPLQLISCTRLTAEKGKDRMIQLSYELDKAGINYIWYVFTNDKNAIDNPNVVYVTPRLNVRPFIQAIRGKGYGVQLSDCEGDCYFTRECEAFGVPLIVTPVPSFKKQGLVDGINCYYVPFDMNNIDVKRFLNIPSYEPYLIEDEWLDNLILEPSKYEEDKSMKIRVECIETYSDLKLGRLVERGEELIVDRERADVLLEKNLVKEIEIIKEEKKEDKKKPTTKKEKAIK